MAANPRGAHQVSRGFADRATKHAVARALSDRWSSLFDTELNHAEEAILLTVKLNGLYAQSGPNMDFAGA